jgi:hypothetical protein
MTYLTSNANRILVWKTPGKLPFNDREADDRVRLTRILGG